MLKRAIAYEDYDGNHVTETFYFNLSRAEIVRLEVSYEEGLQAALTKIVESKDNKHILEEFERIILMSYGEKSEDGRRFEKSDEIQNRFRNSAAYDALIWEMFTDANAAATFVKGIVPPDVANQMGDQDKPSGPPKIGVPPMPPIRDTPSL